MDMEKILAAVAALYGDAEALNRNAAHALRESPANSPALDEALFSLCAVLDEFRLHLRALDALLGLPDYVSQRNIAWMRERIADGLDGKCPAHLEPAPGLNGCRDTQEAGR